MQKKRNPHRLLLASILFGVTVAGGSMMTSNEISVDFTDAKAAGQRAEWSGNVDLAKAGLGFDGEQAQSRDGWIMTQPMAVGTAWRPALGVSVQVEVSPAPRPIKLANGSSFTPYGGTMYVRFGCDRKHWSNWQELERTELRKEAVKLEFHGSVGVPIRNQTRYQALHAEYRKQDVPWVDDEEALSRWIVSREPDFFVTELPFVGYVQFLYETEFSGGQRLLALRGTASAGIGGMHQPPKDPAEYKKHEGPWRYVAL